MLKRFVLCFFAAFAAVCLLPSAANEDGAAVFSVYGEGQGYGLDICRANAQESEGADRLEILKTAFPLAEGIAVGSEVHCGDKLGTVGGTARIESRDKPHLHFELRVNGKLTDPEPELP